jgi:hypothetical protein
MVSSRFRANYADGGAVTQRPSVAQGDEKSLPDDIQDDLVDYCARPACRREFRRGPGRGRRQAYCSEVCRRSAEREFRQSTQRLSHFEGVVEQLRVDVAAFGRSVSTSDLDPSSVASDQRRAAEDAVVRAGGILAFVDGSSDPMVGELRALYAAVLPVLKR